MGGRVGSVCRSSLGSRISPFFQQPLLSECDFSGQQAYTPDGTPSFALFEETWDRVVPPPGVLGPVPCREETASEAACAVPAACPPGPGPCSAARAGHLISLGLAPSPARRPWQLFSISKPVTRWWGPSEEKIRPAQGVLAVCQTLFRSLCLP